MLICKRRLGHPRPGTHDSRGGKYENVSVEMDDGHDYYSTESGAAIGEPNLNLSLAQ